MTRAQKAEGAPGRRRSGTAKGGAAGILPTRYGWVFIVLLTAMLLGAVNYDSNLGFLMAFLLGAMALVSAVHTGGALARIRVAGAGARAVFAGERAVFECRVENRGALVPAVDIALFGGRRARADLPAGAAQTVAVDVAAPRRGILAPGFVTLSARYPLGLFRAWKTTALEARCLVYPAPMEGPPGDVLAAEAGGPGGNDATAEAGGDDFQGLKTYQPGDDFGRVAWKAFSRGQGLHVKVFAGGTGHGELLDWNRLEGLDAETRLSRLCGMVLSAHRGGKTFRLDLPGRTIGPGRGDHHRNRCLKALALHETA